MVKTFLDDLNGATLENIVRCSAFRGQAVPWADTKNAKLLCDIGQPGHPLRSTAREIVERIDLVGLFEQEQERLLNAYGRQCSLVWVRWDVLVPEEWQCRNIKDLHLLTRDMNLSFKSLIAALCNLEKLL